MILFFVLFIIFSTTIISGIYLENKGFFSIPNDEIMQRYVRLESYRTKLRKRLNEK